jgi:glycosyltransferase involved in cell wall biosynthesis
MRFSITVPVLNGMPYLKHALESIILNANEIETEIIYQDGGSTDGSLELAQALLPSSSIYIEKDLGQYDAINRGFHKSQGDILCWLNADDTLKPGALTHIDSLFSKNPTLQWIVGGFEMIDSKGKEIRKIHQWYKHLLLKNYQNELLFFENPIPQMSVFMRKELFLRAGNLSAYHLAFDYEYWLRLTRLQTPGITSKILSQFRWQPHSKSSQNTTRLFQEQYEIAQKYTQDPFYLFLHRITQLRNRFFYSWLP